MKAIKSNESYRKQTTLIWLQDNTDAKKFVRLGCQEIVKSEILNWKEN